MTTATNTTAPDAEALLSTVEAAGAALVTALEACVAAELPVGSVEDVRRAMRTDGTRAWLAEQARPKGPMVTITVPGQYGKPAAERSAEVEKITDARIILRSGDQYRRDNGNKVEALSIYARPYIKQEEIARIVATGWTPPKAPRASKAAK